MCSHLFTTAIYRCRFNVDVNLVKARCSDPGRFTITSIGNDREAQCANDKDSCTLTCIVDRQKKWSQYSPQISPLPAQRNESHSCLSRCDSPCYWGWRGCSKSFTFILTADAGVALLASTFCDSALLSFPLYASVILESQIQLDWTGSETLRVNCGWVPR